MKKIFTFNKKLRKKRRVSLNVKGTKEKPRISVFRSNKYIYCQVIDDIKRQTLASFSSLTLRKKQKIKKTKSEEAKMVGIELAKIIKSKGINQAVFDRSVYKYHGRVKAVAEGLREGGIKI